MKDKGRAIALAVGTLFFGVCQTAQAEDKENRRTDGGKPVLREGTVRCRGAKGRNACTGHNGCRGTGINDCSGNVGCKAQGDTYITRKQCKAQGGKVIE